MRRRNKFCVKNARPFSRFVAPQSMSRPKHLQRSRCPQGPAQGTCRPVRTRCAQPGCTVGLAGNSCLPGSPGFEEVQDRHGDKERRQYRQQIHEACLRSSACNRCRGLPPWAGTAQATLAIGADSRVFRTGWIRSLCRGAGIGNTQEFGTPRMHSGCGPRSSVPTSNRGTCVPRLRTRRIDPDQHDALVGIAERQPGLRDVVRLERCARQLSAQRSPAQAAFELRTTCGRDRIGRALPAHGGNLVARAYRERRDCVRGNKEPVKIRAKDDPQAGPLAKFTMIDHCQRALRSNFGNGAGRRARFSFSHRETSEAGCRSEQRSWPVGRAPWNGASHVARSAG
jgi:hypothetical protein